MPGVRDAGDFAAMELTRGCEKMDSSLGVNRYNLYNYGDFSTMSWDMI
jgi:hypothetical protein